MESEVHYADAMHAIGSVGNVFINVIRQPITLVGVRETRLHVQRHFRRWSDCCVALTVIEPAAAQSVPREVRDASAALTTEFKSLAAATVIEGSGFRAAATRTAVAGMFLLARAPFPHKVFGSLRDGADWVIATGSRGGRIEATADALLGAVERTRGAMPTQQRI